MGQSVTDDISRVLYEKFVGRPFKEKVNSFFYCLATLLTSGNSPYSLGYNIAEILELKEHKDIYRRHNLEHKQAKGAVDYNEWNSSIESNLSFAQELGMEEAQGTFNLLNNMLKGFDFDIYGSDGISDIMHGEMGHESTYLPEKKPTVLPESRILTPSNELVSALNRKSYIGDEVLAAVLSAPLRGDENRLPHFSADEEIIALLLLSNPYSKRPVSQGEEVVRMVLNLAGQAYADLKKPDNGKLPDSIRYLFDPDSVYLDKVIVRAQTELSPGYFAYSGVQGQSRNLLNFT